MSNEKEKSVVVQINFSKKSIPALIGAVGALLLFISIFLPVAKYSLTDTSISSLFDSAIGGIVLSCTLITILLMVTKRNVLIIFPVIVLLCEIISGYSAISGDSFKVGAGLILATIGEVFLVADLVLLFIKEPSVLKSFLGCTK